ncbi:MAG: tetratricopeptide repeat protein [Prevotellaceae bacterium]|nr:tetratricopeptide repeat protein [Prevotellaceae bacterium]MDY6131072.1 tetratricopeptide repeat protein [Prevotella sp.]
MTSYQNMKRLLHKLNINRKHIAPTVLVVAVLAMMLVACATEKNTPRSRWWHSFNAKYNTYYNGSLAYIDGSLEKENGNRDNFTEIIPLYTVANKKSRDLGKGNFDRAIEKSQKAIQRHSIKKRPEWTKNRKKTERDIEWLNRREYNPFLWKVWMLMGRSQFHKGAFEEAASTFAYMSRLYATQPAIYGKARAWLAKCYVQQNWIYDAEDVIVKMERDSIDRHARKEWDYTYADYFIHTHRYAEAIPYLRKVIRHEGRRKQKAREWYLLGQLEAALGHKEKAYRAFKKVTRLNPPYEVDFNARIAMSEVMAEGRTRQMVGKLRRMAASDKNKEYLDQVYYAIGNIYLAQKDTANAIAAYEQGNQKSTRNGIEKGVLLLHLGDLYWQREAFGDARRCYSEAIGLLDKDREDYEQLSERSKVLDELVPFTDAVHLQDSLQALAKMSEKERNAAIDRVIEALKKKEKEERDREAEANAQEQLRNRNANGGTLGNRPGPQPQGSQQKGVWYFYNPMAVNQGKAAFQKLWGKRENVDNWQRINKTVVAQAGTLGDMSDAMRDSIYQAEAARDSLEQLKDSARNDPHRREFYLAQIPFTEEQVQASNLVIMDGLYQSGVIFKDKLDNLVHGERQLRRLADHYPGFGKMDDAFYHLYLLYMRKGNTRQAQVYLERLKAHFAESPWTKILSDPYFEDNARFGVHLEDSLYAATYEAFKANRLAEVAGNSSLSQSRFPLGANRDKFIFIGGLGKLNSGDTKGCTDAMQEIVDKYPQSEVCTMAGMIINGVKAGRRLHGGKFDVGDVWERRSVVLSDSDSIAAKQFVAERNDNFVFLIAFEPDSVNENQLLFELSRFNFTHFLVRNFELSIEETDGLRRMKVGGFLNYDEVLQYVRQLYGNKSVTRLLEKARAIIISEPNLELLGSHFSYKDYDEFYEKHFVPLKISTVRLLTEPAEIEYEKQPEAPAVIPDDGIYNGGVLDKGVLIDLGIGEEPKSGATSGTVVAEEVPLKTDKGTIVVEDAPQKPQPVKPQQSETQPSKQQQPVKQQQSPKQQKVGEKKKEKEQPKKQEPEPEDEYYDLEGF